MAARRTLVVPAWIGPGTAFNWRKGAAYEFGIFTATATKLHFLTQHGEEHVWARKTSHVEYPWFLMGIGMRVRGGGKGNMIAFSKPYSDAPSPDPTFIESASDILGMGGLLGGTLGDLADLGGNVLGNVGALLGIPKGRRTREAVREYLMTGIKPTHAMADGQRSQSSGRRTTDRSAGTARRVSSDEVRAALPPGTFTVKDIQERTGASATLVRRVISEEFGAGERH